MERLNKDELFLLANKLNISTIVNLCQVNKSTRNKLCKIWEYKLFKEYDVNNVKDPKQYLKLSALSTVFWTKKAEYDKNLYNRYDNILRIWTNNIDKLLEIFENHYPRNEAPVWINYNMFRNDKLVEMLEKLCEYQEEREKPKKEQRKGVYFTNIIPIAYCSTYLYTGSGSMLETLEFQTNPVIPIEEFIF